MTIYYSLIARGTTILCSHQIGAGTFESVARSMLPNIPTSQDTKRTYTASSCLFHVIVENGIMYICATAPDFSRVQAFSFLEEVKKQVSTSTLATQLQFANERELDRDFGTTLIAEMERYSSATGGNDQVSQLRAQVDEVKGVMSQNIEKVLERGERIEELLDKTEDLEVHAQTFKKSARQVHKKMWWRNTKMKIILAVVVLLIIFVIVMIILGSTGALNPKPGPKPTPSTTTKKNI